jgi:chromosomal replication initiation ATPase DnaA
VSDQLIFPFEFRSASGREDFIVSPSNEYAVALIDRWPDWPLNAAALYGPSGSGKSHLVQIWQERANAIVVSAPALTNDLATSSNDRTPLALEDFDSEPATPQRDGLLFALLNRGSRPLLLTGRTPPAEWAVTLPDLASRLRALPAFALWAPDEALLAGIARKLFTDRQLEVPDTAIMRMVQSLERSPAAIRDFVALADAAALAGHRPINAALIRELLAEPSS